MWTISSILEDSGFTNIQNINPEKSKWVYGNIQIELNIIDKICNLSNLYQSIYSYALDMGRFDGRNSEKQEILKKIERIIL